MEGVVFKMSVDIVALKQAASDLAVEFVRPGMLVGLGAGSTATLAVRRLGEWYQAGRLPGILGIPCSQQTEQEARRLGIPLTTLEDHPVIDLTIDGADEVDPELNLIKGGGGALLREKIVAQASRREIIVVDESKLSPALGSHWAVPVEVIPFGWGSQAAFLQSLHAQVKVRLGEGGVPYKTDQGNLILDCQFGPLVDAAGLAAQLKSRAGIVEHGLFIGLASDVIVAGKDGCRHLIRRVP
jgi:ribose 5-phosphate isomerase A